MRKKIKLSEKLMEKHGNIRVNLEMQVLDEGNWNERGVYYLAENLLDLKKGEDYKNLKTTVQIGILGFDLWKAGENPFYQVYELWDTEHERVFTNKMKLSRGKIYFKSRTL